MSNQEFILLITISVSYLFTMMQFWHSIKDINEQLDRVKHDLTRLNMDVRDLSKVVRRHTDEIQVISEKIFKEQNNV